MTRRVVAVALAGATALGLGLTFASSASSSQAFNYPQCVAHGGPGVGPVSRTMVSASKSVKALNNLPSQAYQHTECGLATLGL